MSSSVETEYAEYDSPSALAEDEMKSKAERIRILKIWAEDEEQLIRASAEGLAGGEENNLQAVQKALEDLQ